MWRAAFCQSCCSVQSLISFACIPQEAAHGEMVRVVQAEHGRQTAKLRQEVAAGALQLANKYERRVRRLAEDADARQQQEAQEIQERCSAHTQASTGAARFMCYKSLATVSCCTLQFCWGMHVVVLYHLTLSWMPQKAPNSPLVVNKGLIYSCAGVAELKQH